MQAQVPLASLHWRTHVSDTSKPPRCTMDQHLLGTPPPPDRMVLGGPRLLRGRGCPGLLYRLLPGFLPLPLLLVLLRLLLWLLLAPRAPSPPLLLLRPRSCWLPLALLLLLLLLPLGLGPSLSV